MLSYWRRSNGPGTLRNPPADTIFRKIIHEDKVGSTNDLATSLLKSGEEGAFVVIANCQTSGRGRLGRTWHSPPDTNVYMSLVVRPNVRLSHAPFLTLLSGVAACNGIRAQTGCAVHLKWPNDLIARKKKLGGILIETRVERNVVTAAVIGMGINVNMRQHDIPEDIKKSATSLLIETGSHYDRDKIIHSVLQEFHVLYGNTVTRDAVTQETDIDMSVVMKIVRKWKELDNTLGKPVSVVTAKETIKGRAVDLDDMCRLKILTDEGRERFIHAGDVILLA